MGPTSSGSFTPVLLRGPAPNGHPCPDGALAASLRLGPLRETSVQPAPKSRFAVSGLSRRRSTTTASRLKPVLQSALVPLNARAAVSGTGFSREEASPGANNYADRTPVLVGVSLLANAAFQTSEIRRMYQLLREQAHSHKSPSILSPQSALDLPLICL